MSFQFAQTCLPVSVPSSAAPVPSFGCMLALLTFSSALSHPIPLLLGPTPSALQVCPRVVSLGPGVFGLEDGCEVRSQMVPGCSLNQGVKESLWSLGDNHALEVWTNSVALAGQSSLFSIRPQSTSPNLSSGSTPHESFCQPRG